MVKTELWDIVERERRAQDYIEYCEARLFMRKCTMFVVSAGIIFIMLALFN